MKIEDIYNKDGSITLCGIKFDGIDKYNLPKWDVKIYKEGKTTYKEIWLYTYDNTPKFSSRQGYLLSVTNRGKVILDDKVLKGIDCEKAKLIVDNFVIEV